MPIGGRNPQLARDFAKSAPPAPPKCQQRAAAFSGEPIETAETEIFGSGFYAAKRGIFREVR
jgi:hypothetical protein